MTDFREVPLGQPLTFKIERGHVQPGRTFSPDAVKTLVATITEFIMTQVSVRWEQTNEPPSVMTVTVKVDVG